MVERIVSAFGKRQGCVFKGPFPVRPKQGFVIKINSATKLNLADQMTDESRESYPEARPSS